MLYQPYIITIKGADKGTIFKPKFNYHHRQQLIQ